ncbi:hypothetical protein [Litoribrevibacter albus]|uniref:Uncharacterized protein n=1 Tax=Litoribrevibacter albus TaxID=1473156 RepID=A0AA37W9U7_9GAMM|nr:hypothetical protein [Litoribrevibacter albus]GLQ33568.1 hypothetical protein GCM10007876_40480 [Litoribrevibacter albus]
MSLKQGSIIGLCLLITVWVRGGYSLELEALYTESHCHELTIRAVPKRVLVGTEVQNISEFYRANTEFDGAYSAEMGGATLDVTFFQQFSEFSLTRSFQEPGESIRKDLFPSVCQQGNFIFADGLIGSMTDQGLLIWESQQKIEEIPTDLWILYRRYK